MATIVSCLLLIGAGLLAIFVAIFFLETVAAIMLSRWQLVSFLRHDLRQSIAVLVPAHNESTGLLPTLADIRQQSIAGDRLVVVADNCTDDTASIARAAGAEVIERHDVTNRGKGYALDWGVRHLRSDPRQIIIVIDADCRLAASTLDQLAFACSATARPVQALDLMIAPIGSKINHNVAEFAWRVKNWLRPLGLTALKLPCQLMGTGMAFPWELASAANFSKGGIVEDLRLGLDLTLAGHPPIFCPAARVTSEFPASVEGTKSQRTRWEQGHINTILRVAPKLLVQAIARRNWNLLALALDLAVPPLSLLGMLTVAMFCASGIAALLGYGFAAFGINIVSLFALTLAVVIAWLKCGYDILPPSALWSLVPYAISKIGIYRQVLAGRVSSRWIRTDRSRQE